MGQSSSHLSHSLFFGAWIISLELPNRLLPVWSWPKLIVMVSLMWLWSKIHSWQVMIQLPRAMIIITFWITCHKANEGTSTLFVKYPSKPTSCTFWQPNARKRIITLRRRSSWRRSVVLKCCLRREGMGKGGGGRCLRSIWLCFATILVQCYNQNDQFAMWWRVQKACLSLFKTFKTLESLLLAMAVSDFVCAKICTGHWQWN